MSREALEEAITEHRNSIWPAQLRATGNGGGWTYEAHLARYLAENVLAKAPKPDGWHTYHICGGLLRELTFTKHTSNTVYTNALCPHCGQWFKATVT